MRTHYDPTWWRAEFDSAWEQVRGMFRRGSYRTTQSFAPDEDDELSFEDDAGIIIGRSTDEVVIEPEAFSGGLEDDREVAARFGYGARIYYGADFSFWGPELEDLLREDWLMMYPETEEDWEGYVEAIREGWEYPHR